MEVSFATRKALALLAFLAVARGRHTREKLTALLWPESDPERGRAALRYTLSSLRSVLGESSNAAHLLVSRDAVAFEEASAFDVDLVAFEDASVVAASLASATTTSAAARRAVADKLAIARRGGSRAGSAQPGKHPPAPGAAGRRCS